MIVFIDTNAAIPTAPPGWGDEAETFTTVPRGDFSLHSELMSFDEQRLSSKERLRILRRQEEQKQARQGNPGR